MSAAATRGPNRLFACTSPIPSAVCVLDGAAMAGPSGRMLRSMGRVAG